MTDEKAFPNPHLTNETGMTMRDYFAAKAMQSYIQHNSVMLAIADETASVGKICKASYDWADAMMEARQK
jgi:hypothetical protein